MIVIYHEDSGVERYTDMPVMLPDSIGYQDPAFSYDRCVRFIEMPRPGLDEIWDVSAEVHVTNDDLRDRGKGLYLTSELIIGPTSGNSRVGQLQVLRANGTFNIGQEAHHGLISRRGIIKFTQDKLDLISQYENIFLKLMIWSGSEASIPGDRCEITPERGHLKCLRYINV